MGLKDQLVESYVDVDETEYMENENVFDMSYVPDDLIRRDDKIEEVFGGLAKSVHGKKTTKDILITGPQGTGKTVSVLKTKELLEEINDEREGTGTYFYVSGRGKTGLIELLHEGLNISRNKKHNSAGEYFSKIETIVKSKYLVIIIDDFDKFENDHPKRTQFLLTKLFDMEKVSLVLISNSNDIFKIVMEDMSNFSRMRPKEVTFDPYSEETIKDIILQRAKYVKNKVYDEEIIDYIVHNCDHGDARMAIETFRLAIEEAQKEETKITKDHVDVGIEKYMQKQDMEYISKIKPQYIPFLEAIAKFAVERDQEQPLTMENIEEKYKNITLQREIRTKSRATLYRYARSLDRKYDLVTRKEMEDGRGKQIVPKFVCENFLKRINEYYEENI